MTAAAKIYFIYAGQMSVPPAKRALLDEWPEARPFGLLDESLSVDAAAGADSESISRRFDLIGDYCAAGQADAVLFTCSAFAEPIGRVKRAHRFPVFTPNEALFEHILSTAVRTAVLVTFEASVKPLKMELEAMARSRDFRGQVDFHYVPDTFCAPDHDQKVAAACKTLARDYSAIALGQFSMATATPAATQACGMQVWDTPSFAVRKLRHELEQRSTMTERH